MNEEKFCINCVHCKMFTDERKSVGYFCDILVEKVRSLITGEYFTQGKLIPCEEERYSSYPAQCQKEGRFYKEVSYDEDCGEVNTMNKEAWIKSYLQGMRTNREIAAGIQAGFKEPDLLAMAAFTRRDSSSSNGFWTARLAGAK